MGGTATYAGLVAAALGRQVGILTSAGDDFDPAPFAATPFGERVTVCCHRGPHTTTFENRYTPRDDCSLTSDGDAHDADLILNGAGAVGAHGPVAECAPEW